MKANITIMSGDGVGPEITREAIKALHAIESVFDHDLSIKEVLFESIFKLFSKVLSKLDKC